MKIFSSPTGVERRDAVRVLITTSEGLLITQSDEKTDEEEMLEEDVPKQEPRFGFVEGK